MAALLFGFGCAPQPAPSAPNELLVSAATSLRPAVREVADAYEALHPDTTVLINAGGSGVLLQQLLRDAPVDVFVSASGEELDRLAEYGRIDRTSALVVTSNHLAVVSQSGDMLGDVGVEHFRSLAIANPRTAPLGRYTQQSLEATGAWERIQDRLVLGENARQVVEYVAHGDVQAGIVYRSDAVTLTDRVVIQHHLDPSTHQPIKYWAVAMQDARSSSQAEEFVSYLTSTAAAAVLERYGFTNPGD